EVRVALRIGYEYLELAQGLDRQAGRAQELKIGEVEVLERMPQAMEDALAETPVRPSGSLGIGHEGCIGRIDREPRCLGEVMMDQDAVRRKRPRQFLHGFRRMD